MRSTGSITTTWRPQNRWQGTTILKCPFDLFLYQEIIRLLRPSLIIETGRPMEAVQAIWAGSVTSKIVARLCQLTSNRGRAVRCRTPGSPISRVPRRTLMLSPPFAPGFPMMLLSS
jgi:hypothetical protein